MHYLKPLPILIAAVLALGSLTLSSVTAAAQPAPQITETGIGTAVVGSTIAQLRSQLGPAYDIDLVGDVLVDVKGYEISRDGDVVFIAAAVVGTNELAPSEPLDLFIVRDVGPATAEGLGVGTTITDGVDIYGPATLSYNSENESREFVQFENQPDWLVLRTGTGPQAGIYDDHEDGSFFETTNFAPDAPITSMWVRCSVDGCPTQPQLPDTGATHTTIALSAALAVLTGLSLLRYSNSMIEK